MREHIEDNFPGVTAEAKPGADYLWRARVKREDVAMRIAELVLESSVTSHFKDVMIKKAKAPKRGSLSEVMYAVWNGAAKWQDYAPYSKVPRGQEPKFTWKGTAADRLPGEGQQTFLPSHGRAGTGRYASDFDWDARDWGGPAAKDPAFTAPAAPPVVSDEEWNRMTRKDQQAYLDTEEAWLRTLESDEDFGAAARAAQYADGAGFEIYPAPRNRPGTSRRRKGKGKGKGNRHNQYRNLGFSDGQAAQEASNRQAFLDKHNGGQA